MSVRTPIRPATPADLDALLALEQATFVSDRISRAQWRRHIASTTACVLVADAPENLDGAAVVFYRRGSRNARLYSLAVRGQARGSGLGTALLAAVETDVHARRCTTLRLEVNTGNAAAIGLYERHGYVRGALLPQFYEDGSDAWRYVKIICNP